MIDIIISAKGLQKISDKLSLIFCKISESLLQNKRKAYFLQAKGLQKISDRLSLIFCKPFADNNVDHGLILLSIKISDRVCTFNIIYYYQ